MLVVYSYPHCFSRCRSGSVGREGLQVNILAGCDMLPTVCRLSIQTLG